MDALTRTIDQAIAKNDYASLINVFSDANGPAAWHNVGQGEQRSVAAHFIQAAVSAPSFLPAAFGNDELQTAMITALSHLPSTVPGAADNQLRQKLFDYKVNQESDYAGAARILAGMRMDDDPTSVYNMSPAERCDGMIIYHKRSDVQCSFFALFFFYWYRSPIVSNVSFSVFVRIAECFLAVSNSCWKFGVGKYQFCGCPSHFITSSIPIVCHLSFCLFSASIFK